MALQDPPCVGIHHENRMISGIKKDRIRRLRAYAIQRQQFFAQLHRRLAKHLCKRTVIAFVKEPDQSLKATSFLPEVTGGAN